VRLAEERAALPPAVQNASSERSRGRTEQRRVRAWAVPPDTRPPLPGLACLVEVTRSGVRGGEAYSRTGWYACSLPPCPALLWLVRAAWGAEVMHWKKDAVMGEDACRVRHLRAAQNLSVLRGGVLTFFAGQGLHSARAAIETYAHDFNFFKLFRE
jgi:hypothetical protein